MCIRDRIDGDFYRGKYLFTVDYTENDIADDPAQHKQSHVLQLTEAGKWTGNIVALPNNRVRVTSPAYWVTGEGAPDFRPNQNIFNSKEDVEYIWDTERVFNNKAAQEVLEIEKENPGEFDKIHHLVRGDNYRKVFQETGNLDEGVWSAGTVMGLIDNVVTCEELINNIVEIIRH